MTDERERIDEDPDAETGDTRIRVDEGEHGTYVIQREAYSLVEFPGLDGDIDYERYDWHTDESFTLYGQAQAEQVASMLADEGAFDPAVLFFHDQVQSIREAEYRDGALERGRPTDPCECDDCECDLHTFPDDDACIWCRNGDHEGGDVDGED